MTKKRISSLLLSIWAAGAMLSAGALTASAARPYENCIENCGVYDVQGILTDAELDSADAMVKQISEDIDMYVAVYIYGPETEFSGDSDVIRTADDNYDQLFNPQYGEDTDGILLLINNSTKYDYITTSGTGQIYFYNGDEDNRTEEIWDAIWDHMLAGETYAAIEDFCLEIQRQYRSGPPANAYVYQHDTGEYLYMKGDKLVSADSLPFWFNFHLIPALPMGILIGIVVCAVSMACIKNSYRLTKALSPTNYISHNETKFHISDDLFLRQYQSRTRISSSSSGGRSGGGGGGRSHRSGGGHSHGGGGRRR